MRVIAGSARGRRLRCLKGRRIRPTQDRIKEAIFSSLAARLDDSRVLDVFAGSGALGIEALSRGACGADFVDNDPRACGLIKENLEACGWGASAEVRVIREDALRWLAAKAKEARQAQDGAQSPQVQEGAWAYDVILADPPYGEGLALEVVAALAGGELLSDPGILVVECEAGQNLPEKAGRLYLHKTKKYGDTKISYYLVDEERSVAGKG